jgi:hypothetical protein
MSQSTWETKPSTLTRRDFLAGTAATIVMLGTGKGAVAGRRGAAPDGGALAQSFLTPPDDAKPWVYWWWLESDASKEGITRDLEEMKRQGIGGVLLFDSGSGGPLAPKGPAFMSDEWRDNFRHAVREAARLGIEMGVSLCSGWDAGGPWVEREDAIKSLVWTETTVEGPKALNQLLKLPELKWVPPDFGDKTEQKQDWYRDIAVIASRADKDGVWRIQEAVNLSAASQNGRLKWQAPDGTWTVLRLGYTLSRMRTKNASAGQEGWEIDPLSAQALDRHFDHTAAKLIEDAASVPESTFKYTHIDSWEIGQPAWTANLINEFRSRRGYDPTPYLPALAGKTVNSQDATDRFTWDYRRTLADLTVENYYGRLTQRSHAHGLGTHSESGGPFFAQYIDGLECLGADDIPMAEFWSTRTLPFPFKEGVSSPFFQSTSLAMPDCNTGCTRQAATATHIYGKPFCQAESFTGFNDDWTEDPFFLKPYADRAFCLGLGRIVIHNFTHSPHVEDRPGNTWEHVSIHFNPNITWWDKSRAWLTYLARCGHLLRQGKFAADVLYFSGEAIPNFVLIDRKPLPGYDFDTINAQALLTRATAKNGNITLPDGMAYRYLVLPEGAAETMTPAVIGKIHELVAQGITLVGSRPKRAPGLTDYPNCDAQVRELADALWGANSDTSGTRTVGTGRVIWGQALEEVVKADGLAPDVELDRPPQEMFDWIHRRSEEGDIYFLANGSDNTLDMEVTFRVAGKTPELWDPVTGHIRALPEHQEKSGRIAVPMRFEPRQSHFVVFWRASENRTRADKNFHEVKELTQLAGPWDVRFDPLWGGPEHVTFEGLEDWAKRSEEGIRYYSGTATYSQTFDLPAGVQKPRYIDLGVVKNVAQVSLNGMDLGTVWTAPWRVDISGAVKEKGNQLQIEVVNLWPNRLIGDGKLPRDQRRTVTNVRTYDAVLPNDLLDFWCPVCEERKKTGKARELLPSGLLGPVTLRSDG